MKTKNIIPLSICLGSLILDLSQPGYRKFPNIGSILKPANQLIANQSLDVKFPVGDRGKNCKSSMPPTNYSGFTADQWAAFKEKGMGQKVQDVVNVIGQPFCVTSDGKLQFFPAFSKDKKLLIETENGRVKNAKFI